MPKEIFDRIWANCAGKGCMGANCSYILHEFLHHVKALEGDVAELGVYSGATAKLIAQTAPGKTVHLFDTWEGLVAPERHLDGVTHYQGEFSAPLEQVRAFLSDCPNARFYKGVFPSTSGPVEHTAFCFVHLDVDLYVGTKAGLEFFYPRMVSGGILISDDYNNVREPGCKRAIDEFFASKPEMPIQVDEVGNQAFIWKL